MAPLHVQLSWVATITWFALLILFVLNVAHCAASVKKKVVRSSLTKINNNWPKKQFENQVPPPPSELMLPLSAASAWCFALVFQPGTKYEIKIIKIWRVVSDIARSDLDENMPRFLFFLLIVAVDIVILPRFFFVQAPLKPSPFDLIKRVGSMIRPTPMDC